MIVCSCNYITTDKIRKACKLVNEQNDRLVLNMMGWEPECLGCTKVLILEIKNVFNEINNRSLTGGNDNDR